VSVAVVCGLSTGTLGEASGLFPAWALWALGLLPFLVAGAYAFTRRSRATEFMRTLLMGRRFFGAHRHAGFVRKIVLVFVMYCALCVLHGFGLAVLLNSFMDQAPSVWVVVSANAVAWLVGFLIPIAPSGIGVREGAVCLVLSHAVPVEIAALSALLWRLAQVVSELVIVAPVAIHGVAGDRKQSGDPLGRSL
ncbi:MAG: flippase-like domain-containing protein, partial [Planctomycetes bacterium]|nr:flippase-like domain-containing protein [Planctomycetota bacterium]